MLFEARHDSVSGFTIVEILVSLAVLTLIAGIVISYSKNSERQVALYVETQKIAETIFRAKSLALATFVSSASPSCGYGVSFDYNNQTYSLFSYEPPLSGGRPDCLNINPIDRRYLVNVSSFSPVPGVILSTNRPELLFTVLFVPPAPRTLISSNVGGALSNVPAAVRLTTSDGLAGASITVNLAGQVDFR